jgi:serine/threonine protein phosphatase PrpC
VCDIGRHHARNEDAVALSDGPRPIVVVCDGVTSATDSDVAAIAASVAARDLLATAPDPTDLTPAGRAGHWSDQLVAAGAAANAAAAATAASVGPTENPPSCTFVAAVVDDEVIVTGCVGDSRAYWLGDDGTAEQLTLDDSWAAAQIAGGMARSVAEADARAHAITRWLGVDSGAPVTATATTTAGGPGWLLVCTDGLWNYCSGASAIAQLITSLNTTSGTASVPSDGGPLRLAEALVAWANEQGGQDNVTAALVRVEPPAP